MEREYIIYTNEENMKAFKKALEDYIEIYYKKDPKLLDYLTKEVTTKEDDERYKWFIKGQEYLKSEQK